MYANISKRLGILKALRTEIDAGYLDVTIGQLVRGDLFTDFLEMAEHLLEEGYKDPSAVIIGSSLEAHLRKLCDANGLPTTKPDRKGNPKPIKASQLNQDLLTARVYSRLDQSSVDTWLKLRNEAAHGNYSEYDKDRVKLMLDGVKSFLLKYPA
jgi:hypothetical protein